eukprot:568031-Pleurochrysis_carterae.AAC.2
MTILYVPFTRIREEACEIQLTCDPDLPPPSLCCAARPAVAVLRGADHAATSMQPTAPRPRLTSSLPLLLLLQLLDAADALTLHGLATTSRIAPSLSRSSHAAGLLQVSFLQATRSLSPSCCAVANNSSTSPSELMDPRDAVKEIGSLLEQAQLARILSPTPSIRAWPSCQVSFFSRTPWMMPCQVGELWSQGSSWDVEKRTARRRELVATYLRVFAPAVAFSGVQAL